jgi:hypothetical protein
MGEGTVSASFPFPSLRRSSRNQGMKCIEINFDRMDRMHGFTDLLSVEYHRHRSKTESRPIL